MVRDTHTECGMEYFTNNAIRKLLSKSLSMASVDAKGWKNVKEEGGSDEANFISFLTISNQSQSVVEDIKRIKSHPLVPSCIPVYGYIYDVKSDKLVEIPEATQAGKAL